MTCIDHLQRIDATIAFFEPPDGFPCLSRTDVPRALNGR
jgi:hypothetical protein